MELGNLTQAVPTETFLLNRCNAYALDNHFEVSKHNLLLAS